MERKITFPPESFLHKVLVISAQDDINFHWAVLDGNGYNTDGDGRLVCFVNCNDLFAWATADAEEVTPENIKVLEQTLKDVKDVGGLTCYADNLFACRIRGMRPQWCAYPGVIYDKEKQAYAFVEPRRQQDIKLHALFDACGMEP